MSSDEIAIDGIALVRSRDAARIVGHAPDYISRLARGGIVAGRLVDGLWYVNLASLQEFVATQERQREIWRAELARQRREEQRLAGHPSAMPA